MAASWPVPERRSRTNRHARVRLGDRDRALLADCGLFGVLTSAQVKRRHFPATGLKAMWRRLKLLCDAGYLDYRVWGYGPGASKRGGYLPTAKGLRAVGLHVPAARNRESVLASLPHDATVADVAEWVLRELTARLAPDGVRVEWITERQVIRGVPWLPADVAGELARARSKRPDGVVVFTYTDGGVERIAVEVDTTQHGARALAERVAAYRRLIERGVYHGVWWFAVPGGALGAVERAIAHAAARGKIAIAARPIPAGVTVYE